jgi:hypothetical protein
MLDVWRLDDTEPPGTSGTMMGGPLKEGLPTTIRKQTVMQALISEHSATRPKSIKRFVIVAGILLVLLPIAFIVNNTYNALRPAALPPGAVTISQSALEERYGLRVNLVAVTGAGGFVDVRLKLVDGDKAKLLLADAKNFPSLFSEKGVALHAPADTTSQKIEFISGGNLFILYPNAGNAVTRGSPVRFFFGTTVV